MSTPVVLATAAQFDAKALAALGKQRLIALHGGERLLAAALALLRDVLTNTQHELQRRSSTAANAIAAAAVVASHRLNELESATEFAANCASLIAEESRLNSPATIVLALSLVRRASSLARLSAHWRAVAGVVQIEQLADVHATEHAVCAARVAAGDVEAHSVDDEDDADDARALRYPSLVSSELLGSVVALCVPALLPPLARRNVQWCVVSLRFARRLFAPSSPPTLTTAFLPRRCCARWRVATRVATCCCT